ncbi:MAG: hypothetical protein H6Q19_553 [Bacteroidetes bacterium]|nr:hypothetical protein [Bacteroidota bacterium]
MKNYFNFTLTGKQLFPVWALLIVFFFIPYSFVQYQLQHLQDTLQGVASLGAMTPWYALMLLLLLVEYAFMFYIVKLTLEHVEYNEKLLTFTGKFGDFMRVLIPGFLLTLITFGIYGPWFLAKIMRFYAGNTRYEQDGIEFKGKGSDLFVIILLTLVIPMVIVMVILISTLVGVALGTDVKPGNMSVVTTIVMVVLMLLVLIPYCYYVYKWYVNFRFKGYEIQWKTNFWNSAAQIALQLFLSVITIGIYSPLATLKLFQYFAERTEARSEASSKTFGYDIEAGKDLLFIWGQLLLTAITIGIWFPWAYCSVNKRILGKTYVEAV